MKKKILISALLVTIGFTGVWADNGIRMNAHHTPVVRNILSGELPATLRAEIKQEYKDYWITDLYEVVEHKQPSYFITVENADQVVKLNASGSEDWVLVSTTVKGI